MAFKTRRSWTPLFLAALLAVVFLTSPAATVKEENFKTCAQSGFCLRNRALADRAAVAGSAWTSPYALAASSVTLADGVLKGMVRKTVNATSGETVRLPLRVTFLASGLARVTVDEERRQRGEIELRHDSKARKERYNELDQWAIAGGLAVDAGAATAGDAAEGHTKVVYGPGGRFAAVIRHKPFGIDFLRDGEVQVVLNERGLMNVEHWRKKVDKVEPAAQETATAAATAEAPSDTADDEESSNYVEPEPPRSEEQSATPEEDTLWEESFGGNTDTKPRGPESMGMDITFPGYEHVYGIPEHTGPLSLKQTRKQSEGDGNWQDPYRLYNADVFEYIMDSPMTLYGAIPFMQAHKKDSTVGVFWMNAAEMWVDIVKAKSVANRLSLGTAGHVDTRVHWFAESGLLDMFVLLGPSPKGVSEAYGELTGYTQLPQEFAIAYHQCRWNYMTDADVRDVDRKFDHHGIPYDIIWLDLEYLDDRKYFTWEPLSFKDPVGMQQQLAEHQRKLVVLIDPHIKSLDSYHVHKEISSKSLAVKDKAGKDYEGWCWPGNSNWVDCFNPAAVKWWKSLFTYDRFVSSTPNLFIWNDMNEPSVFSGPETTMPKDNLHHGGWEHRDVHNVNGLTFHNATFQAMLARDAVPRRPFVLTRSFFSGSQRLGAMWTGDNQADWDHLAASIPMVLNQGISGFPFAGADVGGFFGNPSKELLTRWYQAGAFYPFFRAHAHLDTRRREPYLAGPPYTGIITQALRLRYSLLPAWYTAFHTASVRGHPIVRPNWYEFPGDERGFAVDDQMYLGETGLLVKPVTAEDATSADVYLADAATYYDYFDYTVHAGAAGRTVRIDAPLDTIPLLMQSGRVFPRRDRPRRSSGLMRWDPVTLVVVLDRDGPAAASGSLYMDDGESYDYEAGAYVWRNFTLLTDGTGVSKLMSVDLSAGGAAKPSKKAKEYLGKMAEVLVEKVIVVGAPAAWKGLSGVGVALEGGSAKGSGGGARTAGFEYHEATGGKAAWAVVKKPGVSVASGWKIEFS